MTIRATQVGSISELGKYIGTVDLSNTRGISSLFYKNYANIENKRDLTEIENWIKKLKPPTGNLLYSRCLYTQLEME